MNNSTENFLSTVLPSINTQTKFGFTPYANIYVPDMWHLCCHMWNKYAIDGTKDFFFENIHMWKQ